MRLLVAVVIDCACGRVKEVKGHNAGDVSVNRPVSTAKDVCRGVINGICNVSLFGFGIP